MVEMLTEALDVIDGKLNKHDKLFAMRQLNFNNSAHKTFVNEKGSIVNRAIFGDLSNDTKKWLDILSKHISENDNISFDKVKNDIAKAYIKNVEYYLTTPKKIKIHNQFKRYVPSFLKSLKRNMENLLKHNNKKSLFIEDDFLVKIYNHFK